MGILYGCAIREGTAHVPAMALTSHQLPHAQSRRCPLFRRVLAVAYATFEICFNSWTGSCILQRRYRSPLNGASVLQILKEKYFFFSRAPHCCPVNCNPIVCVQFANSSGGMREIDTLQLWSDAVMV